MSSNTNTTSTGLGPKFEVQVIASRTLLLYVNIFIYAIIALVAILRLPRLIALFGTNSEWYSGHFFRHVPFQRKSKARIVRNNSSRTVVDKEHATTDDSHTLYSHGVQHHYQRRDRGKDTVVEAKYPPHIASVPQFLRPLLGLCRIRVTPNYSAGQLAILANYFYAMLYAALFRSNPFTDATRTGWIAVAQLPLVFALAQKNNIIGSLLGEGYEKLNFVHRFAGRIVALVSNLHAIYYFYKWTAAGTFVKSIARPNNAWGMLALVCVDILLAFSTSFWREHMHTIFLWTHVIALAALLPALYLHQSDLVFYILACVALYGLDRILRLAKTRITSATILSLPQLDATHLEIPHINAGWRAGQHLRLRVLSRRMGLLAWTEVHPFTIASVSGSQEGLVLMCKQAGDWSRRLAGLAKQQGYVEGEGTVRVMIDGPYGGSGRMMFASFSAAVLVVGGSGVTYGLSMVQDLVAKDLRGESRLKYIELVWVVPDAGAIMPLVPLFTSLVQQSVFSTLRISVYYTRALTTKLPLRPSSESASHGCFTIHPNFVLAPGRPRIAKTLDAAIARAVSLGSGPKEEGGIMGVAVGVCGPAGLGQDVVKAVAAVDPARRDQVGGIEIHEETFG